MQKISRNEGKDGSTACWMLSILQSINYCHEAFVIRYTTCTVYVYDDEFLQPVQGTI